MAPFQVACLLPFVTFTWTMLKRGKGSCWHTTAFQAIRCQLVSQDFSVDCPLKNRQTLPVKSANEGKQGELSFFDPERNPRNAAPPTPSWQSWQSCEARYPSCRDGLGRGLERNRRRDGGKTMVNDSDGHEGKRSKRYSKVVWLPNMSRKSPLLGGMTQFGQHI